MKKNLLLFVILPLLSSFTSCIEEQTRNTALAVGTFMVIGGIAYYYSKSTTNNTASQNKPAPQSMENISRSSIALSNDLETLLEKLETQEIAPEITAPQTETLADLTQQPTSPYTTPQITFLKTLKTSLEELEIYQKDHH